VPKFQITIVGLGAIGTSIGLALKRITSDVLIVGHDEEPTIAGEARKRKAVDRTEWNLISACEKADLVVIATPLGAIEGTLRAIGSYLQPGCLVTDTASLKEPVLAWAEEGLSSKVSFVGGHPIVMTEALGPEGAHADLFDEITYCLCPAPSAAPEAVERVSDLVTALGAKPYFIDAVEHDSLMAAVGHLPIVWAAALLGMVSTDVAWREMARLGGIAFANSTSAIRGDPSVQSDLCRANRKNLLRWIDACQEQLSDLREAILSEDAEALETAFTQAAEAREKWVTREVEPKPEIPEYRRSFGELFFGRLARRK